MLTPEVGQIVHVRSRQYLAVRPAPRPRKKTTRKKAGARRKPKARAEQTALSFAAPDPDDSGQD